MLGRGRVDRCHPQLHVLLRLRRRSRDSAGVLSQSFTTGWMTGFPSPVGSRGSHPRPLMSSHGRPAARSWQIASQCWQGQEADAQDGHGTGLPGRGGQSAPLGRAHLRVDARNRRNVLCAPSAVAGTPPEGVPVVPALIRPPSTAPVRGRCRFRYLSALNVGHVSRDLALQGGLDLVPGHPEQQIAVLVEGRSRDQVCPTLRSTGARLSRPARSFPPRCSSPSCLRPEPHRQPDRVSGRWRTRASPLVDDPRRMASALR